MPALRSTSPNDKRFVQPEWHRPPFNALAQGFLLTQQWWYEAMTGVRGVSHHHEDVAEFVVRQWLDIWSPSNSSRPIPRFSETVKTEGLNLVNGAENWARDAVAVLTEGSRAAWRHSSPARAWP